MLAGAPTPPPIPAIPPVPTPPPPPTAPVPPGVTAPDILMKLLPEPPESWKADKPEGATSQATTFPITTVSRVYVKGDADDAPTATLHIIDSANNQQFQEVTKAMWAITSDTPAAYDKGVTIQGFQGFEHFAKADQSGALWIVVGSRFFVQVETTHQPAAELEAWLARIDLDKLAALK